MATDITAITDTALSLGTKSPRQFQSLFDVIPFKVTLEDDTLPAQTASTADVSVLGAEVGDFVLIAAGVDLTDGILVAQVSAADVVTVTFFNVEGTDAKTALATPSVANGVVLKPKGIYDAL